MNALVPSLQCYLFVSAVMFACGVFSGFALGVCGNFSLLAWDIFLATGSVMNYSSIPGFIGARNNA